MTYNVFSETLNPSHSLTPWELRHWKIKSPWDIMWHCLHDPTFSRFSRTSTCDRQTDKYGIYRAGMASRSKNMKSWWFNLLVTEIDCYQLSWNTVAYWQHSCWIYLLHSITLLLGGWVGVGRYIWPRKFPIAHGFIMTLALLLAYFL